MTVLAEFNKIDTFNKFSVILSILYDLGEKAWAFI